MKRPLAYLTAAWSGEPDIDMELAAHYCRLAYEAGFPPPPLCPLLYLPLFLSNSVPEEYKAGIDIRREKCDAPERNPTGCRKVRDVHKL